MVHVARVAYIAVEVGDAVDFADQAGSQRPRRDVVEANVFGDEAVALEGFLSLDIRTE